jgi:hypothetical protein
MVKEYLPFKIGHDLNEMRLRLSIEIQFTNRELELRSNEMACSVKV